MTILRAPDDATVELVLPRMSSHTQEFRNLRSLLSRHAPVVARPRDQVAIGVAVAAAVLSVAACVYFAHSGQTLGHHDTYSHLEISRRILSGRTTGIAQLGTIWLPLPHLLQALFAWNWTLYITGLAGAFVSMIAFVAASTLVYRIVRVFSPQRAWPAVAAAAVFMTNPNMLHHQSTPMDELPFYAFALASVYGLVCWAETQVAAHVLRAAMASLAAMLCRYEGWFLAGLLTVAVVVIAWRTGHSGRDVRGLTATFAVFGVLTGSVGWLLYNWMIAGSPLNFVYGPNSSADQMSRRGTDIAVGSWATTLHAYSGAVVADVGLAVLVVAAVGLVVFLRAERLSARSLPVLALSMIIPFYLFAIERGIVPIGVPPVYPSLLNVRFGLVALLPVALFVGFLLARLPGRLGVAASVLAVLGLSIMSAQTFGSHRLVTVREFQESVIDQASRAEVGEFLASNTTGPILINLVNNERVAFPVLDRVIYEGTKSAGVNIWSLALRDPQAVGARVVVMRNSATRGADDVYAALHDTPAMAAYHVVFTDSEYVIYELNS